MELLLDFSKMNLDSVFFFLDCVRTKLDFVEAEKIFIFVVRNMRFIA